MLKFFAPAFHIAFLWSSALPLAHGRYVNLAEPGPHDDPPWADAETRAFLDRPDASSAFAKFLHLILIIAMVAAATKTAMVLLFRV